MIRPLRRLHYRVFIGFAVLLPAIFISGLMARRSIPVVNQISGTTATAVDRVDLIAWDEAGLRIGAGAGYLDVVPAGQAAAPGMLLYWSPRQPEAGALDNTATLVGALDGVRGQRFSLPSAALEGDGYLIVWSLAHRRLVAVRPWPKGGGR